MLVFFFFSIMIQDRVPGQQIKKVKTLCTRVKSFGFGLLISGLFLFLKGIFSKEKEKKIFSTISCLFFVGKSMLQEDTIQN